MKGGEKVAKSINHSMKLLYLIPLPSPVAGQVNIYVDAVINHMCGAGGGEGSHSTCGTWFSANRKEFPSIPFSSWDFNDHKCRTSSGNIENYGDANQVYNGRLAMRIDGPMNESYA